MLLHYMGGGSLGQRSMFPSRRIEQYQNQWSRSERETHGGLAVVEFGGGLTQNYRYGNADSDGGNYLFFHIIFLFE